jgi:hypothetical protein
MGFRTRPWLAAVGTVAAGAVVLGQGALAGAAAATGAPMSPVTRVINRVPAAPGSAYVPAGRTLTFGMRGSAVKALQRRLNFLHYYAGKANGYFGWDTMEAVWAFKEVQTGKVIPPNPDIVGPAMQRGLKHPKLPKVLKPHGPKTRIEINKKMEVLVLYRDNKIVLISHTSTAKFNRSDGSGWVTPDGRYRALRFAAGWVCGSLGCMYNPVVFTPNGAFAIHGEPNPPATISEAGVPLNPASHGCVRIPMDISLFFHRLVRTGSAHGTPIFIAGPNYYG